MRSKEMTALLELLTQTSPRGIFFEVSFLDAWLTANARSQAEVPLGLIVAHLAFFEREFNWRPRLTWGSKAALQAARPILGLLGALVGISLWGVSNTV